MLPTEGLINIFGIWGIFWGKSTESAPDRCHPFPRSASRSQSESLPLRSNTDSGLLRKSQIRSEPRPALERLFPVDSHCAKQCQTCFGGIFGGSSPPPNHPNPNCRSVFRAFFWGKFQIEGQGSSA